MEGSASNIPGEPSESPKMDREGGLAVSTAATNGKVVCAIFANGNLVCFDLDGKQKWAKNIGTPENNYGYSSSLLIRAICCLSSLTAIRRSLLSALI